MFVRRKVKSFVRMFMSHVVGGKRENGVIWKVIWRGNFNFAD